MLRKLVLSMIYALSQEVKFFESCQDWSARILLFHQIYHGSSHPYNSQEYLEPTLQFTFFFSTCNNDIEGKFLLLLFFGDPHSLQFTFYFSWFVSILFPPSLLFTMIIFGMTFIQILNIVLLNSISVNCSLEFRNSCYDPSWIRWGLVYIEAIVYTFDINGLIKQLTALIFFCYNIKFTTIEVASVSFRLVGLHKSSCVEVIFTGANKALFWPIFF